MIKISQFSLDGLMQMQYFSTKIETYQDLLRLLWFVWISQFFLDLDKKKADLDSQENLDTFRILVSTIKNSQLRSRFLDLVLMAICKSSTSQPRSRLIKTCWDFCDFCWFLDFCLDLDKEIPWIFINLDRDSYFCSILPFSKISQKMLRNLDKSRQSQ